MTDECSNSLDLKSTTTAITVLVRYEASVSGSEGSTTRERRAAASFLIDGRCDRAGANGSLRSPHFFYSNFFRCGWSFDI